MKTLNSFIEEKDMEMRLHVAYTECWKRLLYALEEIPEEELKYLANPFLVKCLPSYRKTKKKVLFVGQETNGWDSFQETLMAFNSGIEERERDDLIEFLQWMYEDLRFQRKWDYTPFWKVLRELNQAIVGEAHEDSFLHTQLVRFDFKQQRSPQEIEELLQQEYNVLPMEIDALKPDVIIFLTGPYYDGRIKRTFENVSVLGDQLTFISIEGFSKNQLSRLSHPALPYHTYRTYHPGYSSRHRKTILDPVIEGIGEMTGRF